MYFYIAIQAWARRIKNLTVVGAVMWIGNVLFELRSYCRLTSWVGRSRKVPIAIHSKSDQIGGGLLSSTEKLADLLVEKSGMGMCPLSSVHIAWSSQFLETNPPNRQSAGLNNLGWCYSHCALSLTFAAQCSHHGLSHNSISGTWKPLSAKIGVIKFIPRAHQKSIKCWKASNVEWN